MPEKQNLRAKDDILALMQRLGLQDRIAEAAMTLPDPVDLVRDAAALENLGLSLDKAVDQLGGSAW